MYIALYKDGQYTKAKVEDGHVVTYRNVKESFAEIYTLWTKTWYNVELNEELLESFNIPNLGYIKTNVGFKVYDISKEEYREELLPVYVDVFGSIMKSKKTFSYKVPTNKSIAASKTIFKKIVANLEKMKQSMWIEFVKGEVEKGNGIAYIQTENDLAQILAGENIKILFSYSGCYVVGSIAKKPVLDLYVTESKIPMIIGKGGKMINKIKSEIGAKKINIKPI